MTSTDMAGLINLEKIDMEIPEQVPSNEQDLKSDAKQTITLSKLNKSHLSRDAKVIKEQSNTTLKMTSVLSREFITLNIKQEDEEEKS